MSAPQLTLTIAAVIERVDLGGRDGAAGGADRVGDRLQPRGRAARQIHACALARERAGGRAADRAAASVDHRGPVLEQHGAPRCPVVSLFPTRARPGTHRTVVMRLRA
jgi:hypothetical protein